MTVKATKAAMKLAGMYYLNLDDVPFLGAKVTVEDVKKHLEESKGLNPEENDVSSELEALAPPATGPGCLPGSEAEGADLTGASVMIDGKFLGTVVGPVTASDGKRLWRVKSPSHPTDCETIAYAPEDLTKVIG